MAAAPPHCLTRATLVGKCGSMASRSPTEVDGGGGVAEDDACVSGMLLSAASARVCGSRRGILTTVGRICDEGPPQPPTPRAPIDGPENVERQEDVATPVLKKSDSFDERRTSFVRVARKVSQQKQIALSSLPAQGSLAEQIAVRIIEQRYKSHLSVVPRDFTLAGGDEPAEWGTLQFVGVKESSVASKPRQAQYVRLAHDSSPVRITRILTKFWKIDRPSFIISIIGGASADLRRSSRGCRRRSRAARHAGADGARAPRDARHRGRRQRALARRSSRRASTCRSSALRRGRR